MKNCPYCGSAGNLYFKVFTRNYCQCRKCDLIYKNDQGDYKNILASYSNENYFSRYSCEQIDRKRDKLFTDILDSIEKGIGNLLDVGTGCGFFLLAAQKRGWKIKGIDPSRKSVEVAIGQNKLDVFCGTLQEYPDNEQFDVITFINVLDHSAEPWKEIKRANDFLNPGGLIYIRIPNGYLHNHLYKLASKLGLAGRAQKFLVFHQFAFTQKFIQRLLADSGFSKITILNSPPSAGDPYKLFPAPGFAQYIKRSLYLTAQVIRTLSCGKMLLGTSLAVMAIKN